MCARDSTTVPGALIAPFTRAHSPADPPQDDIVEEALTLFRANILFRNFEPRGGADRILLYLQLIILQALKRCSGRPRADAARELHTLASGPHVVPGDAGWPLGSLLPAPKTAVEADAVRAYFRQLRETLVPRLLARLYSPDAAPSEMPNKHWMQFSKRKFMGREFADR